MFLRPTSPLARPVLCWISALSSGIPQKSSCIFFPGGLRIAEAVSERRRAAHAASVNTLVN